MKIRLKLQNDVARSLGVSAYVIQPDFNFTQALVHAISIEGLYDHLDELPAHYSPSISPASTSPLSSPPSSTLPTLSTSLSASELSSAPPNQPNAQKRKILRGKSRSKRNKKRQRQEAGPKDADAIPTRKQPAKHFVPSGVAFQIQFSMEDDAPVASTSYVGLLDDRGEGEGRTWSLKELKSKGFEVIKAAPHTTVPLVDTEHRVVGLVAYGDSSITQCTEEAAKLIRETRPAAVFTGKGIDNRRGNFGNLNAGVAHGGGRVRPQNIVNDEANAAVVDTLINSVPFQRLSGYATGIFKSWAPRLYKYCSTQFERLLSSDDSLIRIFDNSAMASAAFNFGPRTICVPHIDFGNLPFLWCWIWSLGWFNWKKGGHLVLWDFKLIIEFPPGTAIAIPSGVCRHGNTRIGKNETRYSFTQYSSGGNFRWVEHGFQTEEKYCASLTAQEAEEERVRKEERWEMGLNLFSTLEELGLHT